MQSVPAAGSRCGRIDKAQTHDRILRAAAALFSAHGYDRTSIRAVAERAEISHGAVFWHFGDKEGLFREVLRTMLAPFVDEFRTGLENVEAPKQVIELIERYVQVTEKNAEAIRAIVRWQLESEKLRASIRETVFHLHGAFVRNVQKSLDKKYGNERLSTPLASAIVSMLDGNLLLDMLDPCPRNRELRHEGLREFVRLAFGEGGDGA